mmetsp:Transcript_110134/g.311682  ORF Transcript_110134/g.311682 Transcript_110134/m.311682 type:complete len:366 (+) Transcript_110134:617-1714(+)
MTRTPARQSRTSFSSSTARQSAPVTMPGPPQSVMTLRCTHGAPPMSTRPASPRPTNSLSSIRPFALTSTAPHLADENRLLTICGELPTAWMQVPQRPAAAMVHPTMAGSPPTTSLNIISTAAAPFEPSSPSTISRCRFRTIAFAAPAPSKRSTGTPWVRRVVSQRPSPSRSTGRCTTSVAGSSWTPARISTLWSGSSTGTASIADCASGNSSDGAMIVCRAAECESDGEPQSGTHPSLSGSVHPARTRRNSAKARAAPGSGESSSTARHVRSRYRTSCDASSRRPPRQRAPVLVASHRPRSAPRSPSASSHRARNSAAVPEKRRTTGLPFSSRRSSQSADGSAHWYFKGGRHGVGPGGASGRRHE